MRWETVRRLLVAGLAAGILSGLAISVIQEFTTTPIILHAEEFEGGGHDHDADAGHGAALVLADTTTETTEGEEAWAPEDGLERTLYTTLANVIAGVGFALLLVAAMSLAGGTISARHGVVWGMAGFAAFTLAPALGLPPEVPGALTADLPGRQIWWLGAVLATAAGLALMVFGKRAQWIVLGLVLIILPHAIGAPQPAEIGGAVPPELAGHFAAASIATSAIFWAILGLSCGWIWDRLNRKEGA